MKTIAVITIVLISSVLIGLPLQNGLADNFKINEPVWNKAYTQNSNTDILYVFHVQNGDNVSIDISSISGSGGMNFGLAGGGGVCQGYYLFYSSSSNDTTAIAGYINFPLISIPYKFWIVAASEQAMCIHSTRSASSSITFTINKINYTQPQDPAIKELQDQVKELQTNTSAAIFELQILENQYHFLTSIVLNVYSLQNATLEILNNLLSSYDLLNKTLNELNTTVNNINTSTSQNISRIEHNITQIDADLYDIHNQITVLSKDEDNITDIQGQLHSILENITHIYGSIQEVKNTMPKPCNCTDYGTTIGYLQNEILQLQKENAQLRANIDTLNKTKNEKTIEKRADNKVSYGAIALGIVALIVAIIAIMTRKPKTPIKDNSDEASTSKDYDEVEEKPKEIPKAKAKKSKNDDDEDLDVVMSKLED